VKEKSFGRTKIGKDAEKAGLNCSVKRHQFNGEDLLPQKKADKKKDGENEL
jgi:hypothetical protein